jgi:hypothetical protein
VLPRRLSAWLISFHILNASAAFIVIAKFDISFTPHPDPLPSRGDGKIKDQPLIILYHYKIIIYQLFLQKYIP